MHSAHKEGDYFFTAEKLCLEYILISRKAYTSMPKPYRIEKNSDFKEENGGFSDGTLKQVANHKAVSSLRIAKAIFIGDAAVGKTSLGMFYFRFGAVWR